MRRRSLLVILCAVLIGWLATVLPASSAPRHVVVIYDERTALPGLAAIDAAIISKLSKESAEPVQIYSEGMELSRFGSGTHIAHFRDYLRAKYSDRKIDVVIAVLSPPLDFLLKYGQMIFPRAAIVFCQVDQRRFDARSLPPNVTGVLLKREFVPTLQVALQLHPDTKTVVVVAGTSEFDTEILAMAKEDLAAYENQVEFIYLTTLPLTELLTQVSRLPPHTIVLFTSFFRDGAGVAFVSHNVVEQLSTTSNAPVYGFVDQFLGRGIVGGTLYSPVLQGEQAAGLTAQILAGASPSALPIVALPTNSMKFDWRQLRRWGISESRLPPGSQIFFRDPSAWEKYRVEISAIIAVILVQATLITWLLYEHKRRRRSESAAHELSGQLISAHEDERARIARGLHDDISQRLAALAIDAGRCERNLKGVGHDAMRSMRERLARLGEDVHALSYRLHPRILKDLGLIEALKSECGSFTHCPLELEIRVSDTRESLPPEIALCLFRIAQEGMRNIVRHAKASRAEILLEQLDRGLQLTVTDDGVGFDLNRRRTGVSLGLASMRQRILPLGGKITIKTSPGHGTTIVAWVPLKPSAYAAPYSVNSEPPATHTVVQRELHQSLVGDPTQLNA